ncbi:hypothetical protein LTR37_019900 [Vermiconidia calcicola]|uniref:Uncharacterized protein n=1 Tax=Vermiconidia calcicola TaxID=1690605 RepID=A0ACC3MD33_9PEZI|nr:hypothetical protein LTR37_019900 [Vermiconidia calcicola]
MAKLKCAVPDCGESGFNRQTFVNSHIRDVHKLELEVGKAGNIPGLRKRQQRQFTEWLRLNKPSAGSRSLFADANYLEDDNNDAANDEEPPEAAADKTTAEERHDQSGQPHDDVVEGDGDVEPTAFQAAEQQPPGQQAAVLPQQTGRKTPAQARSDMAEALRIFHEKERLNDE